MSAAPGHLVLRDYQREAIAAVRAAFADGRERVLVQLPTGSGKTVVFAHLVAEMIATGGRALVLAHRDELIGQAAAKLRDVLGEDADIGVVQADINQAGARIVVASVQTVCRQPRLDRLGAGFALIVIDEAHHAVADTYRRILRHFNALDPDPTRPRPYVLGVTATADRGDGVGLDAVFEQIVFELPLLPMIEAGYLADLRAVQVTLEAADYSRLSVRGGDVSEGESGRAFLDANGPGQVATAIREHAPDRKALVFVPTVRAAHDTAAAVTAAGLPAAAIDGATPADERRATLRAFARGETRVLANCGVLTEGYDEPSVDCVVLGRPTRSRALFTQMVGRGTRKHPGKADCLVIDLVGAATRHDLLTVPSLLGLPVAAVEQAGGSIVDAAEAVAANRAAWATPLPPDGRLVARAVELFCRRPTNWIPTNTGRFVLATGQGVVTLKPNGDAWDAVYAPAQGGIVELAAGVGLELATGIAEDHARALGAGALLVRDAGWRHLEPTPKQLAKLRYMGVPTKGIATRGEAADAITAAMAMGAA